MTNPQPGDYVLVDWSAYADEDGVPPGPWPCQVDVVHDDDGTFDCSWVGQSGTSSVNLPLHVIVPRGAAPFVGSEPYVGFGDPNVERPPMAQMGMGATRRARELRDREQNDRSSAADCAIQVREHLCLFIIV
jgi:hypothetical protein